MSDYIYINPKVEEILKREGLVELRRLLAWSEGELVGEHGGRTTWRVARADEAGRPMIFYIRQEHRIPISEVVEDLCRFRLPASRGYKTFLATRLFTEARIDAAPLWAMVDRRCLNLPSRAAVVQGQAPGRELYQYLLSFGRPDKRKSNPLVRQRVLYELGAFLAKINQAGIFWPDLAAKHLFAQETDSGPPRFRFTLIDVERAEAGLTATKRDRQLDYFLRSLRGLLTPTDLMRMARGYLGMETLHPRSVRRTLWQKYFPKGLDWLKRANEEMSALGGLADDQPLAEEELYERVAGAVVNMRFKPALRELGLLEKGALFSFQTGQELSKPGLGRRVRMRFEGILNGNRTWFYLKRIQRPTLKDQADRILSGTVRHSRCWHERYMIKQLGRHRIPTPVVVAYAEKMFLGYERAGALVTQGIVGQSLERFVPKYFRRGADLTEVLRRRNWIRRLAGLIRRFHQAGFCHRDLYLSHIFIGFKQNGEPVFHLIDLARSFSMRFRKERWIVKDLAALNFSSPRDLISKTDRMRFLKGYLGSKKLSETDKKMARKIVRKSDGMERHRSRRRSVLSTAFHK